MHKTSWVYINKTNQKEMESGDLLFLLHQLKDVKGLRLPQHVDVDLMLRGRVEITVLDTQGKSQDIIIGEHSPARGIYFKESPMMH